MLSTLKLTATLALINMILLGSLTYANQPLDLDLDNNSCVAEKVCFERDIAETGPNGDPVNCRRETVCRETKLTETNDCKSVLIIQSSETIRCTHIKPMP